MWSYSLSHGPHAGSASTNLTHRKQSLFILFGLLCAALLAIFAYNVMTAAKISNIDVHSDEITLPAVDIDAPANQSVPAPSSTQVQTSTSTTTSGVSSSTSVEVNGQSIPVPENGATHTTIQNSDGSQVSVSVESNSSHSARSNSFTHLNVNSTTRATNLNYHSP